jgi:small subunit ribosomal protein S7e
MSGRKVIKPSGKSLTDLEKSVSDALVELESTQDLKADLRPLYINAAKQIEVGGKNAIVIFVPVPLLKAFHKVQVRITRELEKKFSGKHVMIVAQRRIVKKPNRNRTPKQPRPRSRTLTAVHDAILEDLVYPTEVVAKRTRVKTDGSRLIRVFLDRKDQNNVEHKLESFAGVYKVLTGKDVKFGFPEYQLE